MIVHQRIKDFETLGLGMFVHFGIYSTYEKGEWARMCLNIPKEEYESLCKTFNPKPTWAKELAQAAKGAGCRYITLTTRHHDGFSLYDTRGLSDFDAPHSCGRDLIREFVDACREEGILPFFYHTLVDWHVDSYNTDFPKYLQYLRSSVEVLCTHYGPIGGFWFDGKWDKPQENWEEDALYTMIRRYQPDSILIHNSGMNALGALGHIELDSVTFERGKPKPINLEGTPKYIASEMCEVLNGHWGFARLDLNYSSMKEVIETLAGCRRYRANLLLNVGPMGDGSLRLIDRGILEILGIWVERNEEALRLPAPAGIPIEGQEKDFLLRCDNDLYLFVHDVPGFNAPKDGKVERFVLKETILSACWLDSGEPLPFSQECDTASVTALPMAYGTNFPVRVMKITVG